MEAMLDAGLEAVCVSSGSARAGNLGAEWTLSLGVCPATVVVGLPVIPRFGLDSPENNILLAAYLNQPIILVGHHWDLANGTEILSSAARAINGLGDVTWSDMTTLCRNNYRHRVRGHVMHLQTFSRVTTLTVPDGISELELEAPWPAPDRNGVECRGCDQAAQDPVAAARSGWRFAVTPGSKLDLVVRGTHGDGSEPLRALPRTPLGTIFRKVLVEVRDRTMPYLPRDWVKR